MIIGTVEHVSGVSDVSKINEAKEKVLKTIFETIKEIANSCEDFYIVKTVGTHTTVGTKIILPTVNLEDE